MRRNVYATFELNGTRFINVELGETIDEELNASEWMECICDIKDCKPEEIKDLDIHF